MTTLSPDGANTSGSPDVIKIGLAQINNSFSGQHYLPYSVGALQAYVQKQPVSKERYEFLPPLYKRLLHQDCLERLLGADVAAFSAYVWNVRISIETARSLKQAQPDTLIIFGGPQVPDKAEQFLRENPFINVVVHGEGEVTFFELLEALTDQEWSAIQGISYLNSSGDFVYQPRLERVRDLSVLPSPYLDGAFNKLMAENPDEIWLAMFETNRGCPYSCTYCDWGSATAAKVFTFSLERVAQELEWFAQNKIEFIFCCDANFGIFPRDVDIARVAVDCKEKYGYPHAFSIQTAKNAVDRTFNAQMILANGGLSKGVTISLQTNNMDTLEKIKRKNIPLEAFTTLAQRFAGENISTYTDFIIGLPGETYDSFADGVSDIIESGQHNRIQFNDLSILPNAEMGNPAYIKEFGLETVETEIVNIHGSLDIPEDGIYESQELVIATGSLSREDWRRTKVYSWITALFHFNKLLQFPLLLLSAREDYSFRQLFETIMTTHKDEFPTIGLIVEFFFEEAEKIQNGGTEFIYDEEMLGIYWPADEYMLLKLSMDDRLDDLFEEAGRLFAKMCKKADTRQILDEALSLNRKLLKQPHQQTDIAVNLNFNLPDFRKESQTGGRAPIRSGAFNFNIKRSAEVWTDWETWMREVVWYGHRKGAYLYEVELLH